MGNGGLDHDPPRFQFLAVRSAGPGHAKGADKGRKGDALQDERNENCAERKKDNQIPMGKRAAISQRSGKGESGGKGHDSSHTGPAEDEDLAEARQPLILVEKAGPHEPGDACTREDPDETQQDQESAKDRAVR